MEYNLVEWMVVPMVAPLVFSKAVFKVSSQDADWE